MYRWILAATVLVAASDDAAAQRVHGDLRRAGPIKDAGIYHVDSGTWTRASTASANLGPDVAYSSTARSGYWAPFAADITDEGTLPGPTHPQGGIVTDYVIDGCQISYCAFGYSSVSVEMRFFDSYTPCDTPTQPANCLDPAQVFVGSGLPASGCWIVTFDLAGGGEFCLVSDGGPCAPGYQGGDLDHFGWGQTWTGVGGTSSAEVGSIVAGFDPTWAPTGQGTCYNTAVSCALGNTALGARDGFALDDWQTPGMNPGCYWFGGYVASGGCAPPANPGGQFYLQLYSYCDAHCDPAACGTEYCDTSGLQNGSISIDSCSVTNGSNTLSVSGADPSLTLFAYFNVAAGNGTFSTPPGSVGDLCLVGGGPIGRYNGDLQVLAGSGAYTTDIWNSATGGGGGALPTPPGGSISAGDTWNFQGWQRMGQQQPTTWSNALEVLFTP